MGSEWLCALHVGTFISHNRLLSYWTDQVVIIQRQAEPCTLPMHVAVPRYIQQQKGVLCERGLTVSAPPPCQLHPLC